VNQGREVGTLGLMNNHISREMTLAARSR